MERIYCSGFKVGLESSPSVIVVFLKEALLHGAGGDIENVSTLEHEGMLLDVDWYKFYVSVGAKGVDEVESTKWWTQTN